MSSQVKIENLSSTKRILDFSQFLTSEMMARKKSGELEWMDLVEVFEGMYIPACEREGRKLLKGNYKSDSTDDRFKVLWEVKVRKFKASTLLTVNGGRWWKQ